jgi:hypothetical protein
MTFHVAPWEGFVTEPGLYLGTPEERYHSDPCPEPSLSATVAKIALNKAMSKAKAAHPRLRGDDYPQDLLDAEDDERVIQWFMDVGSAVHSLSLGAGPSITEIRAPNYKKKDAQELKKEIRAAGRIPLLTKHWNLAHRMAQRLRPVLVNLMGEDFPAEVMACSKSEHGWWIRSLMDGASPDLRVICDVKTTQLDMSPREAARTVNRNQNAFQSEFYEYNADRLDPGGIGRRKWYFIYQEMDWPHEIAIVYPDEALKTKGRMEVEAAMRLWDRAMKTGEFPGYSLEPLPIAPENWAMRALEMRLEEPDLADA